ncbi:hypothetical protein OS190_06670 [Sulfitobacter sp. F26204]|nr:hypothetical protein [Sulfitobacter sp. F26204]
MTIRQEKRGGVPVGYIAELDGIEAVSVLYLRLWSDGPHSQARVCRDLAAGLGTVCGSKAIRSFTQLCRLCANHGRRPLMRHSVDCKCLGADESCFANFIAAAAEGEHEDAMLFATLLVRSDVASMVVSCAAEFGLALKRMPLGGAKEITPMTFRPKTLH